MKSNKLAHTSTLPTETSGVQDGAKLANTPISHVRPTTATIGAAQQWKALEWHKSQLGMVNGEGCCAAEDGVVAELADSHTVTIGVPQAAAAHVDSLAFLLANNNLTDCIKGHCTMVVGGFV